MDSKSKIYVRRVDIEDAVTAEKQWFEQQLAALLTSFKKDLTDYVDEKDLFTYFKTVNKEYLVGKGNLEITLAEADIGKAGTVLVGDGLSVSGGILRVKLDDSLSVDKNEAIIITE